MSDYRRLSAEETRALLTSRGTRVERPSHRMDKRILHWRYCRWCRLMNLNNEVTRRALRAPCVTFE